MAFTACKKHTYLEPKLRKIENQKRYAEIKRRFGEYRNKALREKTSQRQHIEQTVSRVIALQWDSLKIEVLDANKEVAIIPVRYKNRDLVKEGYRKLFIFQDQQGNDQAKIVEIRADSSYLKLNQNQINKHNFTGTITIHDLYKGFENGVVIENGNLTNAITKYTFQNLSTQRDSDCGFWVFVPHECSTRYGCGDEHNTGGYWYFKHCTTNPNDLYNSSTGYIDWMLWLDNQYANDFGQSSGGGGGYTGNDYGDPYYNYQPPAGYEPVYLDEPQEPSEIDDGAPKPNAFNIRGKLADIQTFIGLINRATGNTYAYDADTKTIIRTSSTLNTVTDSTKSAYLSKLIEDVITGEKKFFECKIVNNDPDVLFDNFPDGKIDIADLQKSPDNAFLAGLLVHLIEERVAVPNGGYRNESIRKDYEVYKAAHKIALQREGEVFALMMGLSGVSMRKDKSDTKSDGKSVYEPAGSNITETIQYIYGNIIYEFTINYNMRIILDEFGKSKDVIKTNYGTIYQNIVKR